MNPSLSPRPRSLTTDHPTTTSQTPCPIATDRASGIRFAKSPSPRRAITDTTAPHRGVEVCDVPAVVRSTPRGDVSLQEVALWAIGMLMGAALGFALIGAVS